MIVTINTDTITLFTVYIRLCVYVFTYVCMYNDGSNGNVEGGGNDGLRPPTHPYIYIYIYTH
jgi:hypothetical protein